MEKIDFFLQSIHTLKLQCFKDKKRFALKQIKACFVNGTFFHAGSLHDVENTQVLFGHRHWVRGRDDPTTGEVCSHREYVQGQNHISHWTEFPCLDAGLTFIQNHSGGLRKKKLVLEIQKLLEFVDITGYGYERWGGGDGLDGYVQRYNDLK